MFLQDIRRSVALGRRKPQFALAAIAVELSISLWGAFVSGTEATIALAAVSLVLTIAFLGFRGVVAVWYVRLDRGQSLSWTQVRDLNRMFRARYFELAVLFGLLAMPWVIVAVLMDASDVIGSTVVATVGLALMLSLFAFAIPALAFNDTTARNALQHSIAVLRHRWPDSAAYAIVPAVTIAAVVAVRTSSSNPVVLVPVELAIAVLVLLFRGATVLFYARHYPTLPDDPDAATAALTGRSHAEDPRIPRRRSRVVAGLLGVVLGGFGAHRFYLGHRKIGWAMVALSVLSLGFLLPFVMLWGIVEGVCILIGAMNCDAEGRALR